MRARRKGRDGLAAGPPSHVEQSFRGVASLSAMPQYIPLALLRSVRLRGPRAAGSTVHTVRAARRARQYTMYHTIYNVSHNRARSNAAGLGARSVSDLHLARVSTGKRDPDRPHVDHRGPTRQHVARASPVRGPCGARSGAESVHARPVTKVMRAHSVPTHDPVRQDAQRPRLLRQDASRLNHVTPRAVISHHEPCGSGAVENLVVLEASERRGVWVGCGGCRVRSEFKNRTEQRIAETTLETARCGGESPPHASNTTNSTQKTNKPYST